MASIRSEYHRFLAHLAQRHVHDDVRRLAHLVLDHLQPLAEVGAARRGRSTRLAPLAIAHLAQMPVAYDGDARGPENGPALGRLHQLEVGPFRGFMRQETFDLSHDITLVYGANGTGKSSFCEALEVAMLGSISEAQAKRVDQRTYCNNARLRRHVAPVLSSRAEDQPQAVQPDEAEYRFCFIEKNRIDAFSRMAQRPQGQRAELIATLFGMEKFNDFCNRFNDQMVPPLVIETLKQTELRLKREALTRDRATANGEAAKLAQHDAENEAYAVAYRPDTTFTRLKQIIGSAETPGRLAELDSMLNAVPSSVIGVNRTNLAEAFERADAGAEALSITTRELQRRASQVSFRALYGAVVALEAENADRCPACETPLEQVTRNPFEKARRELDELRELAAIQERQNWQRDELTAASEALRAVLAKLSGFVEAQVESSTVVRRHLQALMARPERDGWWKEADLSEVGQEIGSASLEQLLAVARQYLRRRPDHSDAARTPNAASCRAR
mgnify:CR=1 FL=1